MVGFGQSLQSFQSCLYVSSVRQILNQSKEKKKKKRKEIKPQRINHDHRWHHSRSLVVHMDQPINSQ